MNFVFLLGKFRYMVLRSVGGSCCERFLWPKIPTDVILETYWPFPSKIFTINYLTSHT